MQLERAKQLAREFGFSLKPFGAYDWNLFDPTGALEATLNNKEFGFMAEEDFVEFYLQD